MLGLLSSKSISSLRLTLLVVGLSVGARDVGGLVGDSPSMTVCSAVGLEVSAVLLDVVGALDG